MLKSNVAACHLKLEDWKEAVKTATAALDGLDKLQGKKIERKKEGEGEEEEEEEAEEEIISEGAEKAENTSDQGKREADIERIRTKALLRRARARSELGGWSSLQGSEEGKSWMFRLGVEFCLRYPRLQDALEDVQPLRGRSKACSTATGGTPTTD